VFAKFIHILTLVAFAAHAVCGCCGHHEHPRSDVCCSHAMHDQMAGHEDCQASHDDEHDCESSHKHTTNRCVSNAVDYLGASHSAPQSPCDHSHGCSEVRCTYMASSSASVDWDAHCSSLAVFSLCSSIVDFDMGRAHVGGLRSQSISIAGQSSVACCALLQSWQI
jgi:hypothetical protein